MKVLKNFIVIQDLRICSGIVQDKKLDVLSKNPLKRPYSIGCLINTVSRWNSSNFCFDWFRCALGTTELSPMVLNPNSQSKFPHGLFYEARINKHNTLLTRQKAFITEIQLGKSADRRASPTPTTNTSGKWEGKGKKPNSKKSHKLWHTRKSLKRQFFGKTWIIPISNSVPI